MASAGRILIMPKGAYNANTTYEMLDMVSYNGTTWLAKKTVKGVEPSGANVEYWHNFVDFNKNEYANKRVASGENNTVDPNTTTLARVRTKHANCPTADAEYVVDTIFVDGGEEIHEKHQYARGTGDTLYTRCKGYNGAWAPWVRVMKGGTLFLKFNPGGKDYIDFSFEREGDGYVTVFANAAQQDSVFVTGVSLYDYVGNAVMGRIKLSQAVSSDLYVSIGYLY